MKITSIELSNFKAIGETVVIPVKPITLIFGANSTGKSSIMQCLAMLAQSVKIERWEACLFGKGPLVDVGNYHNFIHEHDTTKSFECKFNFDMDVTQLFDYQLPDNDFVPISSKLNDSAKKFKKNLATFKATALSFCFRYDTLRKQIFLDNMDFFLDANTKPVFSYSAMTWKVQPNLKHIFWKTYWDIFKKAIYEKFYDYPKAVAEGRIHFIDEGVRLPEDKMLLLKNHLSIEHNFESLFVIYGLMYPDEPFYRQLQEEAQQGKTELDLFFKLYNYEVDEGESSQFSSNRVTQFSGFLPSKFAYLTPGEFLSTQFLENIQANGSDVDFFHPVQLLVLVATYVQSFLSSFSYLGPLRKRPERFYVAGDATAENGGGDNFIHLLSNNDDLVCRVNLELEHLQTGYQIKIVHLSDQDSGVSGVFLLQFIDQKTGMAASIKDIGFGFSQILPVIVQCIVSSYSNVIIEQPELHLHPAFQAELGDMFIRGNTERQWSQAELDKHGRVFSDNSEIPNDWKNRHNRFFIETHSEHLILRLLRRIRENAEGELPENVPPITPNDIAVLYVQPGNNGAQVTHIPITAEGEFATPWPGGFFAERARELF